MTARRDLDRQPSGRSGPSPAPTNCAAQREGRIVLKPTNSRVVIRPFEPTSDQRIERILARSMSLSEAEVDLLLGDVMSEFHNRHHRRPATSSCTV